MKEEFMCPYCKITGEQVKNASNKEAKARIKKRDTKEVYSSSYMPKDVNRTRLWLVNFFGGFLGLHQFYVGKWKWGLYSILSFVYVLIFHALSFYIYKDNQKIYSGTFSTENTVSFTPDSQGIYKASVTVIDTHGNIASQISNAVSYFNNVIYVDDHDNDGLITNADRKLHAQTITAIETRWMTL